VADLVRRHEELRGELVGLGLAVLEHVVVAVVVEHDVAELVRERPAVAAARRVARDEHDGVVSGLDDADAHKGIADAPEARDHDAVILDEAGHVLDGSGRESPLRAHPLRGLRRGPSLLVEIDLRDALLGDLDGAGHRVDLAAADVEERSGRVGVGLLERGALAEERGARQDRRVGLLEEGRLVPQDGRPGVDGGAGGPVEPGLRPRDGGLRRVARLREPLLRHAARIAREHEHPRVDGDRGRHGSPLSPPPVCFFDDEAFASRLARRRRGGAVGAAGATGAKSGRIGCAVTSSDENRMRAPS
jgi:hypothetical protein